MVQVIGRADDGACISVRLAAAGQAASALNELSAHWPPRGLERVTRPSDGGPLSAPIRGVDVTVARDGSVSVVVDGRPAPGGWHRLESELGLFAAERLTGLVAVHAALIVWHDTAIVVPGPSYAGKSTLCVAAIAAGATVWSDEYALVDPATGLVQGWPRPLRIRASGPAERWPLGDDGRLPVDPLPVSVVAPVHWGPPSSTVSPISRGEAVMAVLANTVCGASRPHESFTAAVAVTRDAALLGGQRGEAALVVEQLLAKATSRHSPSGSLSPRGGDLVFGASAHDVDAACLEVRDIPNSRGGPTNMTPSTRQHRSQKD